MYKDLRLPAKQAHQGSEDSLQKECAEWLKKALLRHGLPQEIFWHVPSEGIRKPQYRMKLKAMGFRSGIPDICLMLPFQEFHGAFCELKKAGGSPSTEQKKLLSALTERGYFAVVINDLETFKSVFGYYIENRTNKQMKTEQRIKEIREELRQLYNNDNDAPRLIAEMLEEFTSPCGKDAENGQPMPHNLG